MFMNSKRMSKEREHCLPPTELPCAQSDSLLERGNGTDSEKMFINFIDLIALCLKWGCFFQ